MTPSIRQGWPPSEMLCCSCLRVVPFSDAGHGGDIVCDACGGDWCGCELCLETIKALRAGRFEDAGLQRPIRFWCAETGVRETKVVDPIVEAVRADLLRRSQLGIEKYGTTLDRKDLNLSDWLQHAYEEHLDAANYLKRAIVEGVPRVDGSRIREVVEEESLNGAACGWISCTGCHETSDGAETGFYPYSMTFGCYLGAGCHECGGIGVVWHHYSEIALREMQVESPSSQPANDWQDSAPTHRHVKRGSAYVLLGIGKMQAEDWRDGISGTSNATRVDQREVAIYRSVDDGSLWARPREEFEDGRFEVLP